MKILFIIYSLDGGGAERATTNLANYFAEAGGNEVSIATFTETGRDAYALFPKVRRLCLGTVAESSGLFSAILQNLKRIFKIRKVVSSLASDVVIAEMPAAGVLSAFAVLGLGRKLLIQEQIHPPRMPLPVPWEALRKIAYPLAGGVVALTAQTAFWLEKNCRLKNVSVIPNPVAYPVEAAGPRLELNAAPAAGRKFILSVGRLDRQKGFDMLIKSFSSLAASYPDWDLVILGEGGERPALQALVEESNMKERIFLPGRSGDPGHWYKRADIYALSSRFEGFPNVLAEAMSYALPAVSFNCETGPGEMISDGVDGLLVPPEDTAAFAAALGRLMSDESLRNELSAKASLVRERFSINRIAGLWEKLF